MTIGRPARLVVIVAMFATLATACPVPAQQRGLPPVRALSLPFRGPSTVNHAYRSMTLKGCMTDPANNPAYQAFGTCLYHPYPAVDFRVAEGTPVRAAESGFIFMRGEEHEGEGDPTPTTTTTTTATTTTAAPPATTTTLPPATTTTTAPQTTTTLETVELDTEPISTETAYERAPGMFVVIDHRRANPGYRPPQFTRYSHLSGFSWAQEGTWVRRGQIIGYAGATQSPNVHIHFDAFNDLEYGPTGGFNEYDHQTNYGLFCWTDWGNHVRYGTPWGTHDLDYGQRIYSKNACR